ncbi:MAG: bifunctional UDP-N-acetylglucosamine diphosphorylase/glucosamine-1-phosphate N-acetyltransferase GlmU [SAR324 cluster bacterium]|uniref:Bifunctional protein GlmU n=1 Tax=SAR324 cluster bacterium TaxID=2024889 RepID=A0A7X9IKF3_9DELT|nr:bifunctional UDP-N-acetylglucosamine diphosphorylase/glucosamine-1-phosphate N-acetyltransferase GlmU [SAR324 cluster bacterium]
MDSLAIIVLAAGLGKRMGQGIPKVLHRSIEKTLIEHVLSTASSLKPEKIVVVTGFEREKVEAQILKAKEEGQFAKTEILFSYQQEQRGTGHAARCGLKELRDFNGTILILYGDVPLLRQETLLALLKLHHSEVASLSLISAISDTQRAYGRIIRDEKSGKILKVIEARDCSPEQYLLREVNSGIYAVQSSFLPLALDSLQDNNAQKEFYLTDIVAYAAGHGHKVAALTLFETEELQGVNSVEELTLINNEILKRRRGKLLASGVQMLDPSSVYVDLNVLIESGVVIGPNTQIRGKSVIKSGTIIEGCAYIENSTIGPEALIKIGVRIEGAVVGARSSVGPFANLRPEAVLGEDVRIGNFVEVKKSVLEDGVKASHLTYLGDAFVGADTNIGAGTITCNYDGQKKHKTTIEKNAFVGSDTVLVAPVTIREGAYIGAASVITKEVPSGSLALTRPPMIIKEGWVARKKKKL